MGAFRIIKVLHFRATYYQFLGRGRLQLAKPTEDFAFCGLCNEEGLNFRVRNGNGCDPFPHGRSPFLGSVVQELNFVLARVLGVVGLVGLS